MNKKQAQKVLISAAGIIFVFESFGFEKKKEDHIPEENYLQSNQIASISNLTSATSMISGDRYYI